LRALAIACLHRRGRIRLNPFERGHRVKCRAVYSHRVPAAIRTDGLTKTYGDVLALDSLGLEVEEGEVFGFIGPNGAGKTTTIRLLLDLIRPTRGSAEVLGRDARRAGQEARRSIGYLPGELHLDESLTAEETLHWFARLRGMDGGGRAAELAKRFDLPLTRKVGELSKGNKQKVGVIQALMHEPRLAILDEPTSGLDPILQHVFHELVAETRGQGVTFFLSSHVLSELEHVADRVGMIRQARLLAVESMGELRRNAPHRVAIRFAQPIPGDVFAGVPGVAEAHVDGMLARLVVRGSMDAAIKRAAEHEIVDMTSVEPDLEEIFLTYYGADGA
jgi:ABC-2 type transport system ATP-binding protein